MSVWPIWPILIPLGVAFVGALLTLVARRALRPLFFLGAVAHAASGLTLAVRVLWRGPVRYRLGGWAPPLGIELMVDEWSAAFLLIVAVGMPLALLYALATDRNVARSGILLCLLSAAVSGWVLTGDLFNLFVFVELASVTCIGLVAFRPTGRAAVQSFVYLLFASISGTLLLLGIALLYAAAGTLNLAHLAALAPDLPSRSLGVATACLIVSFGIKIGLVPLHIWKPDVYAAAGPGVSAILSGVVLSCAVYGLARTLGVTAGNTELGAAVGKGLLIAGCVNVLVGHGMALIQRDLTRLLAFSSVAHAGYMLIGLGLGTPAGLAAGALHAFNHVFMKMGAFYSADLIRRRSGSDSLARLRGIGFRAPIAVSFFILCALALVGVPPMHGFVSKWWLARAALAEGAVFPVAVIAAGTAISMTYYARIFALAFRRAPLPATPARRRWLPVAITAVPVLGCLALGFFSGPLAPKLERGAGWVTDPDAYVRLVFPEDP